jgi:hypothetical protein
MGVGAMSGFIKNVIADRVGGKRPSPVRAVAAAAAAGVAAAGITYKVLRG